MKTGKIFFFSPTGGTERVAQIIRREMGGEFVNMTVSAENTVCHSDELVFFCFPVYGGRIPAPVYERMEHMSGDHTPAVLTAVFGNRAVDDALLEMSELCRPRGFVTVAGAEMVAPHSVAKQYGSGRPDSQDIAALRSFLSSLRKLEAVREVPMPGNKPYRAYEGIPLKPSAGRGCTGCGLCARSCPAGAIDPTDPHKTDKAKCISCMRCVSVCPSRARKVPAPMMLAASVRMKKLCGERKEASFIL